MKVAISNIAWRAEEEPGVARRMEELGIRGVEVAPGKIGPDPADLGDDALVRYREGWAERGVAIVAMQALLFGQGHLSIFDSESVRAELLAYLARIVRLGGVLGAKALVFGSPKNRLVGDRTEEQVAAVALPFFRELGRHAEGAGTCLCIEPNPPEYGADWIHDARAALALVQAVDHPGFGLHLDAGALLMAGDGAEVLAECAPHARHFHASEPWLAPVVEGGAVPHAIYAAGLRAAGYANWVSIEMKQRHETASHLPDVEAALAFATRTYGGD